MKIPTRVHVVEVTMFGMLDAATIHEVLVFAEHLTERQVVESLAKDFEILSETFPKTINHLNLCSPDVQFTLTTQEVLTK